jgi:hypothetical protein
VQERELDPEPALQRARSRPLAVSSCLIELSMPTTRAPRRASQADQ